MSDEITTRIYPEVRLGDLYRVVRIGMTQDALGRMEDSITLVRDDELRAVADAAVRLAKVLDLASSVHTPERRAARIAFYGALRKAGLRP